MFSATRSPKERVLKLLALISGRVLRRWNMVSTYPSSRAFCTIKLAMVKVFTRLKKEALQARLIMQVHDELIVECPEDEAEQVKALLAEEMEGVYALAVPLTAEAHSMAWYSSGIMPSSIVMRGFILSFQEM